MSTKIELENGFLKLPYTDEKTFETTHRLFSLEHYELAVKLTELGGNLGYIVVSSEDNRNLLVCFDFSKSRVDKEIGKNRYIVVIKPPHKN